MLRLIPRPLVVVLIAAALVRLGMLALVINHLDGATRPDTGEYKYFASHLWSVLWSRNPTDLWYTLVRTPGYPLMLAALGQQTLWVLVAQIVLSLLLVIVVYRMALASVGQTGALIAAAIVAFEPVGLTYDFLLLSDVPFAFAFTVGLALWLQGLRTRSWRWLGAAGFTLGLATLFRPVSLYVLVVLIPITALMMRRYAPVIACVVLSVAFALPVGTWVGRNLALTGHPVFSTIEGLNLAYYRGAYAIAAEDYVTVQQARQSIRDSVTAPDSDPVEQADQLGKAGWAALLSHPKGWAEETTTGALYLLIGPGDTDWKFRVQPPITTVVGIGISFGLLVLAISGGVFAIRARRWELLAMAAVLMYIVGVSSAGGAYSRMRLPVEPVIAILAAYALVTMTRRSVASQAR